MISSGATPDGHDQLEDAMIPSSVTPDSISDNHLTCNENILYFCSRRNARVVEWGGLENRWSLTRSGGSNPSFSAKKNSRSMKLILLFFLWRKISYI